MSPLFHRDRIVRATLGTDPAMVGKEVNPEALGRIADYLVECETAFAILRAKGWRGSITDIASAVPKAAHGPSTHD
jgi:hypothetical protein